MEYWTIQWAIYLYSYMLHFVSRTIAATMAWYWHGEIKMAPSLETIDIHRRRNTGVRAATCRYQTNHGYFLARISYCSRYWQLIWRNNQLTAHLRTTIKNKKIIRTGSHTHIYIMNLLSFILDRVALNKSNIFQS